jgi:hypothetical protein
LTAARPDPVGERRFLPQSVMRATARRLSSRVMANKSCEIFNTFVVVVSVFVAEFVQDFLNEVFPERAEDLEDKFNLTLASR